MGGFLSVGGVSLNGLSEMLDQERGKAGLSATIAGNPSPQMR